MKNLIIILFTTILFASCSNTQTRGTTSNDTSATTMGAKTSDTSLSVVSEFLLASSVGDFDKTAQHPTAFREVKMGHKLNTDGSNIYFICGQCQIDNKWAPFATIKTSGYEQWIGAQATTLCSDTSVVWENTGDLSGALQGRIMAK